MSDTLSAYLSPRAAAASLSALLSPRGAAAAYALWIAVTWRHKQRPSVGVCSRRSSCADKATPRRSSCAKQPTNSRSCDCEAYGFGD